MNTLNPKLTKCASIFLPAAAESNLKSTEMLYTSWYTVCLHCSASNVLFRILSKIKGTFTTCVCHLCNVILRFVIYQILAKRHFMKSFTLTLISSVPSRSSEAAKAWASAWTAPRPSRAPSFRPTTTPCWWRSSPAARTCRQQPPRWAEPWPSLESEGSR